MTHPLITQLDDKIRHLITQAASTRLEIEQLEQENKRLQAKIDEWEAKTKELIERFDP